MGMEDLFEELVIVLGQMTYENHQLLTKVTQLERENKILRERQWQSLPKVSVGEAYYPQSRQS